MSGLPRGAPVRTHARWASALLAVAAAAVLAGFTPRPPSFEAYPVPLTRLRSPAPIAIPSAGLDWKMERTLRAANPADPPNFADTYTVVQVGCGTGCLEFALIDRRTGKVTPGAYFTLDFPSDYPGPYGFEFRRDSRLLVVRHAEGFAWPVHTTSFVWDGRKMNKLEETLSP